MRSLFAKTLLWFLATTAVAIAGIIITTAATFSSTEGRGPLGLLLSVQTEQARRAYETGGRDALATALAKFQQITQFQVLFTDAKGTDLLTGKARISTQDRVAVNFPRRTASPLLVAPAAA